MGASAQQEPSRSRTLPNQTRVPDESGKERRTPLPTSRDRIANPNSAQVVRAVVGESRPKPSHE